jgi:hypothetical protein
MSTYLEHELLRLLSLRELLKLHDDTVTTIDSLRIKVEKMDATPSTKLEQLNEMKRQLENKQFHLNSFYKGFYSFTLPLQSKEKSKIIRQLITNYGATALVTSNTLLRSSQILLKELSISPTMAISETSQILDLLTLKPLDEPPEGLPGPGEGLELSPPWVEALYYSAIQSMMTATSTSGLYQYQPSMTSTAAAAAPAPAPASPGKMSSTRGSSEVVDSLLASSGSPSVTKNPFDNVDAMVSGPSIGAGAETTAAATATAANEKKSSTNPFEEEDEQKKSGGEGEVKLAPVGGGVRVNQALLGDLLGGSDGKKGEGSGGGIWG